MKRRLFHLFLIIQICQMCHSDHNLNTYHAIRKRSMVVRNNQHLRSYPPRTTNTGAPVINSDLMNKLRKVLVETLKSLSHVNSKLAHYFVQHHPSLENVYRKLSEERESISKQQRHVKSKGTSVTTVPLNHATSRILVHRQKANKTINQQTTSKSKWSASTTTENDDSTTPIGHTQSKPIFVRLSEFERTPIRKDNRESMNAKNITTSSLNAEKVTSKIVRANSIVANNVIISSAANTNKFQFQKQYNARALPASFSFRNSGNANGGSGFGLLKKKSSVQPRNNRRNYFPPRQDGRNLNTFKSRRITAYPRQIQRNDKMFNIHNQQSTGSHNVLSRPATVRQSTSVSQRITTQELQHSIPQRVFTQQRTKIPKQIQTRQKRRNFWHDSWSDYDSDDDFYDNTSEESRQQPGISGKDINARQIQAKSMFAGKVKAHTIMAHRVVADDVIVSARYGN